MFVGDERCCVPLVAGTNRNDGRAKSFNFVVVLTQLRSMFAAVQSAKMSKEHEYYGSVGPSVTETARSTEMIDK